eukprot:3550818-Alexandrium_andersonii.AAC.1
MMAFPRFAAFAALAASSASSFSNTSMPVGTLDSSSPQALVLRGPLQSLMCPENERRERVRAFHDRVKRMDPRPAGGGEQL